MPLEPKKIYSTRNTRAQTQLSANSSVTTSATSATTSIASAATTIPIAASSTTDPTRTTTTTKATKSFKVANAPRASAPSTNAPFANAFSASAGASSVASASSASVTVKATPTRRARKDCEITEVAQERASTHDEDEYEYESDENAFVSGSERSKSIDWAAKKPVYDRSLVGGIHRVEHVERDENGELISSGRDISTNSNATNYYTVEEHIRCLLYAWRQPVHSRSVMIREHFGLARFQVNGEPWLDMDDPEWTAVKVLGRGEKAPMVYTTTRESTLTVLNSQHVSCTSITQSGRHSGAKEAARLKVAEEDTRTGGRWGQGTGKMHQVYLDKQPITFALAMAGFSVKPFHLRRNEVAPSLVLQRLIFPFIEEAIGAPGSRENELWRKECDLEMQEFDPNDSDNLDDVEPYAFEPNPNPLKMNKATALAQRSKKHVLRMMLRLRRVLLQDAAEYLYRYPDIALSPLLGKCPEVFESLMFDAFKENVAMSLKRHEMYVPIDLPPNLMAALQTWNLAQANGVADIKRALADIHVRLDAFEKCFTIQHKQNNWVNDGLDEIEKMCKDLQKALDRPPLSVFDELEWYDKLLAERKARGLPTTLSGATTKNLNNKRRIHEQVLFLMERNRMNTLMTEEEALRAAFVEIDAVALPIYGRKKSPTSNDGAGLPDKTAPTIGLGLLVEMDKAVGADMAVEAGLIETSTVQVKVGVAERAEMANAVVDCLRGAARQACKVKRRYRAASTVSSGKTPRNSGVGHSVMEFITRLKQLKILESRDQPLMKEGPEYTPNLLVRSIVIQLAAELKKIYHMEFTSFSNRARSLGYTVVGVNEYYTSEKCPTCGENGQTCEAFMHRDVMAGHNMCNIVKTHLLMQTRPLYLQPVDVEGHYPWVEGGESNRIDLGSSSTLLKNKAKKPAKDRKAAVGPAPRVIKRNSSDDPMHGDISVH
ncbi:hypothetical protein KI688_012256 [Linnemannia hyalina]|uniref:Transposase n=1 Tax=Linnemannia hyalina TaxID=64524 RepID=A0A9P7XVM4_9FUNG|nr:hypothetical protein KI688_012256 [Linnemannia hyalina]